MQTWTRWVALDWTGPHQPESSSVGRAQPQRPTAPSPLIPIAYCCPHSAAGPQMPGMSTHQRQPTYPLMPPLPHARRAAAGCAHCHQGGVPQLRPELRRRRALPGASAGVRQLPLTGGCSRVQGLGLMMCAAHGVRGCVKLGTQRRHPLPHFSPPSAVAGLSWVSESPWATVGG